MAHDVYAIEWDPMSRATKRARIIVRHLCEAGPLLASSGAVIIAGVVGNGGEDALNPRASVAEDGCSATVVLSTVAMLSWAPAVAVVFGGAGVSSVAEGFAVGPGHTTSV